MKRIIVAALVVVSAVWGGPVAACTGTVTPNTPTPTPTSPSSAHVVNVGQANSPFDPEVIEIINNDPFNMRSLILELVGPGHLVGSYDTGSTGMGTFHNTLDLTRE